GSHLSFFVLYIPPIHTRHTPYLEQHLYAHHRFSPPRQQDIVHRNTTEFNYDAISSEERSCRNCNRNHAAARRVVPVAI
ncbi:hypothetical protein L2E82_46538, partial [Cichorium intybus]